MPEFVPLDEKGEREEGTRGHGDAETRGRGDAETRGRGDAGTRGRGDAEMRRCGGIARPETASPPDVRRGIAAP